LKSAVILGASGTIGSAVAHQLALEGWSLYLQGHTRFGQVKSLAEQLAIQYPKQDFFALSFDLARPNEMNVFLASLFTVDALVLAQGYTQRGLFTEMSSEEMQRMWHVHVHVPLQLIQKLQPKLARSGHGRIVFISSVYGQAGSSLEVFYSMTKGAQDAFVKAYSKEAASLGITVNAVAPGAIDTQMNTFLSEEETQFLVDEIPVGRIGVPDEISFWVSQLLKESAGYMTGQILTVSGGWLG